MKKKLLSVLLAVVMIATLAPVAFAGDFTPMGGEGDILWQGGIVTLSSDMSVDDKILVIGDTVLNLNGYTIALNAIEPIVVLGGATLTVTGGGEICRENEENGNLFLVMNTKITEPVFDEQGNLLSDGTREESVDTGRLVLEGGNYFNAHGCAIVIQEGCEAELYDATLNVANKDAVIENRGTVKVMSDCKLNGIRTGLCNMGVVETIKNCAITVTDKDGLSLWNDGNLNSLMECQFQGGANSVINLNYLNELSGCTLEAAWDTVINNGVINQIADCTITSEGAAAINNVGNIESIDDATRLMGLNAIFNQKTGKIGTLAVEYAKSTQEAIFNDGTIDTIASGAFSTSGGVGEGVCFQNLGTIGILESPDFTTKGGTSGMNMGSIGTVLSASFTSRFHAFQNAGSITNIAGGTFQSEVTNGLVNFGEIENISGGYFTSGRFGMQNIGTIEHITGGTFFAKWTVEPPENFSRSGSGIYNYGKGHIFAMEGYSAKAAEGSGISNAPEAVIDVLGKGDLAGSDKKVENLGEIGTVLDDRLLMDVKATGKVTGEPTKKEEQGGDISSAKTEFTDMANHWAAGDVSALAAEGVINGLPDGSFGPANDVTRGELAKLVLAVSGREEKGGEAAFADTEGTWSVKYVNGLAGVGIIRADDYPNGFQQGEEATRVEVITMLMRSMGYDRPMGEVKLTFADADGLTAEQAYYVDCAVRRGIIKGMPDGTLKPDENISRAEVATMLRRAEEARPGK